MIVAEKHLDELNAETIGTIRQMIREGRCVRLSLPRWGWLYVDRRLPFLFLHRSSEDRQGMGTALLTLSEASALVVSEEDGKDVNDLLLDALIGELSEDDRILVIEIAAKEIADVEKEGRPVPAPDISIVGELKRNRQLVERFSNALKRIEILDQNPLVDCREAGPPPFPLDRPGVTYFCIELSPIWFNPETSAPFPIVLRDFREELSVSLKECAWHFCRDELDHEVAHFEELGRQEVLEEDWRVDRELSRISSRFRFLLDITPVNPRAAFREFQKNGWRGEPEFHYRRLSFDPETAKGELYRIPVDDVEDPTLHHLFREKRAELARTLTMLEQRNTSDFLYSSLQHYGPVTDDLLELALSILRELNVRRVSRRSVSSGVNAEEFAKLAKTELAGYREIFPGLSSEVKILREITSLMVSGGDLCVPEDLFIPEGRINALLHHEVGTHIVTWGNGKSQPLSQLHTGFAGYDELQEGLAVLAEYLVGELSTARMRLLAGRVIAVRRLIEGAAFAEIFHELLDFDFKPKQAFTITMRVWRSGGLTKDAVYLRGLSKLLAYVGGGGDLELLYVGKITEGHVDLILELQRRRILQKPPLRPRYLDFPEVAKRLERIRSKATVLDLIGKEEPS
ncbi:MAG: DUF1704 domain-containing protein [Thermoanaerobaculia bacterium]|nr:DUF1704 domain-containing protein [Thermoanaerobaculia bacterium]